MAHFHFCSQPTNGPPSILEHLNLVSSTELDPPVPNWSLQYRTGASSTELEADQAYFNRKHLMGIIGGIGLQLLKSEIRLKTDLTLYL